MNDTLNMTLKKEWFDAIFYEGKVEEYREIKPYWVRRLMAGHLYYKESMPAVCRNYMMPEGINKIRFRNGYKRNAREFTIEWLGLKIDTPISKWCPKDTDYKQLFFVLELGKVLSNNFTNQTPNK